MTGPTLQERAVNGVGALVAEIAEADLFAFKCELLRAVSDLMVEQGVKATVWVDLVWPHGSLRLFGSDRS